MKPWVVVVVLFVLGCSSDRRDDSTSTTRAALQCDAASCPIVAENQLPGNPRTEWDVFPASGGVADPNLVGFSTDANGKASISFARGETVVFKVKSAYSTQTDPTYGMRIYRLGYYGGNGARLVQSISGVTTTNQPACSRPITCDAACNSSSCTGSCVDCPPVNCNNWTAGPSWQIPSGAVSGVYVAKLVREGGSSNGNHILFVVRDDTRGSGILFQLSDATWQAYNAYPCPESTTFDTSGKLKTSLYNGAVKVSFERPNILRTKLDDGLHFFNSDYNVLRFLERNGYDVSYSTTADTAFRGNELLEHKVFLSVGHDEYWSYEMRQNVEAARNGGVNLAFLSGNEVYWRTRWEDQNTTIVSYKTSSYMKPTDPVRFTGAWQDGRFHDEGAWPANALTGTDFTVNCITPSIALTVPASDGPLRTWRNTSIATAGSCGTISLGSTGLGCEWDRDEENGFRPPGLFRVANSTHSHAPVLYGPGSNTSGGFYNRMSGLGTHHMTVYRHASGALVFGAGTMQWGEALTTVADAKQATANVLADMGVVPTLYTGSDSLIISSPADTQKPTSNIVSPTAGASIPYGSEYVIQGTATDTAGQVAGVEVSTDGGTTWQRADGRSSWSFRWSADVAGAATIKARAVDDNGNLQSPEASVSVNVGCAGGCRLWPQDPVPASFVAAPPGGRNFGMKFRSDAAGMVTGARFYRAPTDSLARGFHLWSNAGALLAGGTFPAQAGPGWQTANFPSPVTVLANTTYTISYYTIADHALTTGDLQSGRYHQPLRAMPVGGAYKDGAVAFPNVATSDNFWIEPLLTPTTTESRSLFAGLTPANPHYVDNVPIEVGFKFRSDVDGLVNGVRIYRGGTNNGRHTVNLWTPATSGVTSPNGPSAPGERGRLLASATLPATPATGWTTVLFPKPMPILAKTEYIASYFTTKGFAHNANYFTGEMCDPPLCAINSFHNAHDPYGSSYPNTNYANSNYWVDVVFKPGAARAHSLWEDSTPTVAYWTHPSGCEHELGMKFKAETPGYIVAIRFFKDPQQGSGPFRGKLWLNDGTALGETAPLTNSTSCGWQTMTFATPIAIQKDTTYVASYRAPHGISYTGQYFTAVSGGDYANGVWNPPLRALGDPESPNGVFCSTTWPTDCPAGADSFPIHSSGVGSNYWVDVVFKTALN